jgi:hypothetical protein
MKKMKHAFKPGGNFMMVSHDQKGHADCCIEKFNKLIVVCYDHINYILWENLCA